MTRRLLIAAGALALVAGLYLAVSYFAVAKSLEAVRTCPDQTPVDSGRGAEEVRFESDVDQISLAGWLLRSSGDRAIVLGHGLMRHSRRKGDRS
jgi:hypothetical protein